MNILLYGLATVAAGVLAIRVPLADRQDPIRRAFSILTSVLCLTYLGWTLYLLPGLGFFKYLNGAAAAFLPFALLLFVDRFFWHPGAANDPRLRDLALASPLVAFTYILWDVAFRRVIGHASVAEIFLSAYIFLGFALSLNRLWTLYRRSPHRVERARISYFATLASAAIVFSAIEAIARSVGPEAAPGLGLLARPVALQGALPPLGALFATVFLYFLYQMVSMSRLLDLNEIFSRIAAVAIAGAILVLLDSLSAVSLIGEYPVHGLFQVFVASCLFLLAYDPLRKQLETWMGNLINRRGRLLKEALADVDAALARVVSIEALAHSLLIRLVESGRVPVASLFLWDEDRRVYRLVDERGSREQPPLAQVARQPFVDGFIQGERAYIRSDMERAIARDPARNEAVGARLRLMHAMNADVVLPLSSGDLILGWLTLKDEDWSDGFSEEEVARLAHTGRRAAIILENIHSFEKLKEEHRLAALGTMAAGLAHEIRNPLAGIKGAAQYLQQGKVGPDAEMVQVIVDEVDRLNGVVTQFLDYARPFQLTTEDVDAGFLVAQTARMLISQDVEIIEDVAADLPKVTVDTGKMRQVLLNLGQNGIQAMKRGGTLTLRTRQGTLRDPKARNAPAIEVSIEDTGCGIAREDLDKLFVPFYTTRHDGTGLGLAISMRIVQAHRGELEVQSTVGRGSTFTVRLPLAMAAVLPAAEVEVAAPDSLPMVATGSG